LGLTNLVLLPFQPFEQMRFVLATADVLIGILESSAGIYSVPSKINSYLCAQRPLLMAVSSSNHAAKIIEECRGGIVVSPESISDFIYYANKLYCDENLRIEYGKNARFYAETHFNIDLITDEFVRILNN